MPVHCFTVMRLIAERAHRRLGRMGRRFVGRIVHRARFRTSPDAALRRPATMPAKAAARGPGLGAARHRRRLTFGSIGAATPESAPNPSSASAGAAADEPADPGFLLDPGSLFDPGESIAAADPPILPDPSGMRSARPLRPLRPIPKERMTRPIPKSIGPQRPAGKGSGAVEHCRLGRRAARLVACPAVRPTGRS